MSQNLIEQFEGRSDALKVADLVKPLGMDDKTIYRMAARGQIPCFRLGGAIRFDPTEIAAWLKAKYATRNAAERKPPQRSLPSFRSQRKLG